MTSKTDMISHICYRDVDCGLLKARPLMIVVGEAEEFRGRSESMTQGLAQTQHAHQYLM